MILDPTSSLLVVGCSRAAAASCLEHVEEYSFNKPYIVVLSTYSVQLQRTLAHAVLLLTDDPFNEKQKGVNNGIYSE